MNNFNFIWIMIDSVRRYHTVGDDRSRLKYMDEFAESGVEFLNCVTSAPSTLMSLSATLTSLPAYYLGRNYDDFQYDTNYFNSLTSILKKQGYQTDRSFFMHPEVRQKLKQFDLVPRKLWPDHLSHSQWFCNDDINAMVHKVLNYEKVYPLNKPSFWFIDYNCRNDENISNIVKNTVESLELAGYNKDNTVLMISSDHGYPDPKRKITPTTLKRSKLTHDVFMTDDNIMIPLILRYPGCEKGKKISHTISTLDIMPTILDLLQINVEKEIKDNFKGFSLLDLLKGNNKPIYNNRMIRTDARWCDQPGRLTSIRGEKYKYILSHDDNVEEFVDISANDNALIEKSVIDSKDNKIQELFKEFRAECKRTEIDSEIAHYKYLLSKILNHILSYKNINDDIKIIFSGDMNDLLISEIIKEISKSFIKANLKIVVIDQNNLNKKENELKKYVVNFVNNNFSHNLDESLLKMKYDFHINLSAYKHKYEKTIFKFLNRLIKCSSLLEFESRSYKRMPKGLLSQKIYNFKSHMKAIRANAHWYKEEPSLIFKEPILLLRKVFKRELKINNDWKKYDYKWRKF